MISTDQDDVELSVERNPWCLVDDINHVRKSRRNLVIENDLALRLGATPPTFKYTDQLQRHLMSDGLRLPVIVKIRQDVDADDQIRIGH